MNTLTHWVTIDGKEVDVQKMSTKNIRKSRNLCLTAIDFVKGYDAPDIELMTKKEKKEQIDRLLDYINVFTKELRKRGK
jgi:hypothetical protein